MPRPHVEFVHAQQLPWSDAPWAGYGGSRVAAKLLSRDATNGACTALLRLPAGHRIDAFWFAASLEFFVLEGAFELDGTHYGLDDYAFHPAAHAHSGWSSDAGAVLLAWFGAEPELHPGTPPAALAARLAQQPGQSPIPRVETHRVPWTRHDIDPSVQFLNLAHKVLRWVPETGEKTLLLSSGAQTHPAEWREAQLRHECAEEMYLLGGDIIGERGVMYEGAYFWRPPGCWHGPFGSRRGSLSLIRFAEGRHHNIWGDRQLPFSLQPQHAPELPETLRGTAAAAAWVPPRY